MKAQCSTRPAPIASLLCLLLFACAVKRPAAGPIDNLRSAPETFVARVARLRDLPERRPTPIVFDDEVEFYRVANEKAQKEAIKPTPMDTEADAIEFERAMRVTASCWDRAPAATREIFRGSTLVRRNRRDVGLARGFSAPVARAAALQLPSLIGTRLPLTAPFGPISIPPVKVAVPVRRPFVSRQRVFAPRLGLAIPLAEGLLLDIDDDDVTFTGGEHGFASLIFAVSDLAFTPRALRHSFDVFEQALKKPLEDDQPVSIVIREREVQTPVGTGVERVWRVDGTQIHGRLLLLPICQGTGMLVIGQGYDSDQTRARLERVVAGVQALPTGSSVCAELDP